MGVTGSLSVLGNNTIQSGSLFFTTSSFVTNTRIYRERDGSNEGLVFRSAGTSGGYSSKFQFLSGFNGTDTGANILTLAGNNTGITYNAHFGSPSGSQFMAASALIGISTAVTSSDSIWIFNNFNTANPRSYIKFSSAYWGAGVPAIGTYIRHQGIASSYGGHSLVFGVNNNSAATNETDILTVNLTGIGVRTNSPSATIHAVGSGTTSSTTSLLVQNANASSSLSVLDNGVVAFGGNTGNYITAHNPNGGDGINPNLTSNGLLFYSPRTSAASAGIWLFNHGLSDTGGTDAVIDLRVIGGVSTADKTISYTSIASTPVVNNTGGAVTLRGFYFAPSITNATGTTLNAFESTRGNVLFQSGSTPLLFVSESGRVGIGISTPSASLHISGASSNVLLEIDSPAVNNILFVSGSGNVGIGTSTPTAPLFVKGRGNSSSTTAFIVENSTSGSSFSVRDDGVVRILGANTDAQITFTPSGGTSQINLNSQSVTGVLQTATAGTYAGLGLLTSTHGQNTNLGTSLSNAGGGVRYWASLNGSQHSHIFYHNLAEQMRLSYTGNLIVGISGSDTSRLSVRGSGTTSATTTFLLQNSNGTQLGYIDDSGQWMIGSGTNGGYKLDVNGTALIRNRLFLTGGDFVISGTDAVQKGIYRLPGNGNGLIFSENMQAGQIPFQFSSPFATPGTKPFNEASGRSILNINIGLGNPNTDNLSASVLLLDGAHNVTSFSGTTIRGIYYNPTITSLTGVIAHRAIETTTGSVVFNGGNVGIGTSFPSSSLHISGASAVLTLSPQSPLPSGVPTGSFAVSSSAPPKPYFYDGTTWNALY
jgi:hypothetical protein